MADCGDGFNSSYSIARLLAQPTLRVSGRTLKRGSVLLIGGDLAYPNPTEENFEERFVRVFEDAMQAPKGRPKYYEEQEVILNKKQVSNDINKMYSDTPRCYIGKYYNIKICQNCKKANTDINYFVFLCLYFFCIYYSAWQSRLV